MEYKNRISYFRYDEGDFYFQIWLDFKNINVKIGYDNHSHTLVLKLKEKDSIWRRI